LKNLDTIGFKSLKLQFSVFNLTNANSIVAASGPVAGLSPASSSASKLAATQYQWQAPRSFMISGTAHF